MKIDAHRLPLIVSLGTLFATVSLSPRQIVSGQTSSATFLISGVRVFDGDRVRPGMNLVVEDGVIRTVSDCAAEANEVSVPRRSSIGEGQRGWPRYCLTSQVSTTPGSS
jgi:hypothetical protein